MERVELRSSGVVLGTHAIASHVMGCGFQVSAVTQSPQSYRAHLELVASLAGVRGIQWINFNRARIEFETVLAKPQSETLT